MPSLPNAPRLAASGWLVLALMFGFGIASAQASTDVILALDRSLSMNNNDPGRDSLQGATLFTELLNPTDRLGLLTFGQDAPLLRDLKVLDADTQRQSAIEQIQSLVMNGTRTDFGAALRTAYQQFNAAKRDVTTKRLLLIFTDGQLNLGSDAATNAARAEIINTWIPRYQAAGIQIHGVAFSPEGDSDFLHLLTDSTGGQALRAEHPEDIYLAFVKLFEQTDQPLTAPVVAGRVTVDANVRELKLLIPRDHTAPPTALTDPSQRTLTADAPGAGVIWHPTTHFDHIVITNPTPGIWAISNLNPNQRAYLESDLDLSATLPVLATVGQPLTVTARLVYHGQAVDAQLADTTLLSATVLDATGTPLHRVELTPELTTAQTPVSYQGQLQLTAPGPYQIQVMAEHESFQRTKILSMSLLPADQPPATADDLVDEEQVAALSIVLVANLILLLVIGSGAGLWWWRRQQRRKAATASQSSSASGVL
ncbi:von Willebrand factor type A domain-containing protein [Allochromatium warmingii]|uniref:von Willebrand factor type A domain-containing protein n=1 Tax=Allochromatium warmingii TaxID=61595 RepID=A0A1H3F4X0_ALLWA|nr:vWA domain-containing protein [Allochromatium warmingii]SDX85965.1 von Willebrand factor type A domain-containing protein [Allochromatium warmingii]